MKPSRTLLAALVLACAAPAQAAPHQDQPFAGALVPLTDADFPPRNAAKEKLGQFLFFDKVLSGNRNISCATCHHNFAWSSDGLSLSVGEGGKGFGVNREPGQADAGGIKARVPRRSTKMFNLGAREHFTTVLADGRVTSDADGDGAIDRDATGGVIVITPFGPLMGYEGPVAVQTPLVTINKLNMAGDPGENPVADLAAEANAAQKSGDLVTAMTKARAAWAILEQRVRDIPEYVDLFKAAFPATVQSAQDIDIVKMGNAMDAFAAAHWRCTDSPFDRAVKLMASGAPAGALTEVATATQIRGGELFYGKANCASCHSGPFQTDHRYHAIGVPQIGPGQGDNLPGKSDGRDDFGRERVTKNAADRFKFRTPSLRNATLTAPYGHDGAFNSLEAMVRHHLDAVNSLHNYDVTQAVMPSRADLDAADFVYYDGTAQARARRDEIAARIDPALAGVSLSEAQIKDLLAFIGALTDQSCVDLRRDSPAYVPSRLPLGD